MPNFAKGDVVTSEYLGQTCQFKVRHDLGPFVLLDPLGHDGPPIARRQEDVKLLTNP